MSRTTTTPIDDPAISPKWTASRLFDDVEDAGVTSTSPSAGPAAPTKSRLSSSESVSERLLATPRGTGDAWLSAVGDGGCLWPAVVRLDGVNDD